MKQTVQGTQSTERYTITLRDIVLSQSQIRSSRFDPIPNELNSIQQDKVPRLPLLYGNLFPSNHKPQTIVCTMSFQIKSLIADFLSAFFPTIPLIISACFLTLAVSPRVSLTYSISFSLTDMTKRDVRYFPPLSCT